jgi:hypothetical protein
MNRNTVVRVAGEIVKTKPAHFDKRVWSISQLQMLRPSSFWTLAISTVRENWQSLLSKEFQSKLHVVLFRSGRIVDRWWERGLYSHVLTQFIVLLQNYILYDPKEDHSVYSCWSHSDGLGPERPNKLWKLWTWEYILRYYQAWKPDMCSDNCTCRMAGALWQSTAPALCYWLNRKSKVFVIVGETLHSLQRS